MILNDKEIKKLVKSDNLIVPFDDKFLQSESYDLHIGNYIYILKNSTTILDLGRTETLENVYTEEVLSEKGFLIAPKQFVLVSLKETISLTDTITAHIRPRTRFIRAGIYVSSQHCNSTYSGQLRIGICNLQERPVRIYPNIGICQILFEELVEAASKEKQYKNKYNAKYQNEEEFRGPMIDEEFNREVDNIVTYFLGGR